MCLEFPAGDAEDRFAMMLVFPGCLQLPPDGLSDISAQAVDPDLQCPFHSEPSLSQLGAPRPRTSKFFFGGGLRIGKWRPRREGGG